MKITHSSFLRRIARFCMAAAAILITFAWAPPLRAESGLDFYTENSLPPFGGEFRGAAPVVFQMQTGAVIQVGFGHYGRDVAKAPTEPQLRAGGTFPQNGTVEGAIQLSPTQPPMRFSAPASLVLRCPPGPPIQPIPIEMLQMDLQGGSLPAGVMLRESPTLASQGVTTFQGVPGGGYMISSFFDVFVEITLDGGQSWTPASQQLPLRLLPAVSECSFPTECFPLGGDYETVRDAVTTFANGIAIKNLRHRPNALRMAMPEPGAQQVRQLGGTVELDLSQDGGKSFQHFYAVTFEDCLISGYSVNSGGDRPMESLSLNFSMIVPGGPTLMVRESPTLASTGRTSSRAVTGGYMLSSFFDIFTEVSLDGGQTWTPADGALHMALLPYIEQQDVFRSNFVLPRDGSLETWPQAEPVRFPNGTRCRNIRFQDFSHSQNPPEPGITRLMEEEGICYFELSSDGGQTWAQHSAPAKGLAQLSGCPPGPPQQPPGPPNSYDTEMLSLDISGGTLPAGLLIRESPTKASQGRLALLSQPRVGQEVIVDFLMDSFFDVFTEISLDDGQNWLPALNAARLHLRARPQQVFQSSDWLPLAVQYRESDFNFVAHYGGGTAANGGGAAIRGIIVQGRDGTIAQGRAPAPAAGKALTRSMDVPMELQLSLDGGNTFTPGGGQASLTWTFSDSIASTAAFTITVNTEVLQLDLAGGTLPPGVRLRESPTRASTGRTSIRAVPGGYRVSSFFDIFTELSIDGGQTWTPSYDTLHIAAEETAPKRAFATNQMPPNGVLRNPEGAMALCCATGEHIKSAKLLRSSTDGIPPPAPGEVARVAADGTAEFLYSTDGGQSFNPIRAQAYYRYEMRNTMVSSAMAVFDTEMLQLEMWGGNLPQGVMLRESPSKASVGRTSIRESANGGFLLDSFFDVFTELSLDGGQTWTPFDLPLHLEFTDPLVSNFMTADTWPPRGDFRLPPGDPDRDLLFVGGARMSFFDVFYGDPVAGSPLPEPGADSTHTWQAQTRFTLFLPDGTPVPATSNASLTTHIIGVLTTGNTRSFDTEMLQLGISGGGLPLGVMLRESPTKASPGRTTVRTVSGGFMVDSFFDVFLEISFDGGQNWARSDRPLRLEFAAPEIVVEHPVGTELTAGGNIVFSPVLTGASISKPFTIRNIGTADLLDLGITFTGPDAGVFSVTASPVAPVPGGAATTFVVRLSAATAGTKLATMHIANNDANENPFDLILVGRVLTPNGDDDNDGLPNLVEFNLADCAFDPLVNDQPHILTLRDNGFYQASDMHALALGSPVLARDPVSGHFHLSLGLLKSPSLMNWTPLLNFTPMFDPATGRLDCDIAPDGSNAQFFRVLGTAP